MNDVLGTNSNYRINESELPFAKSPFSCELIQARQSGIG